MLWKIFLIFFEGKDLIDELACTQYFHKHPNNRRIHILAFLTLSCVLQVIINYYLSINYCIGFICLVFFSYMTFNKYAAIGYLPIMLLTLYYISYLTTLWSIYYYFIIAVSCLIMQVLAHIAFEKALPANRYFEFFVTAPVVVMLMSLNNIFGVDEELVEKIREESNKWKDCALENKIN